MLWINTKTVELLTQDQELRRHSSSTQDLLILSSRNNKDGTSVIIVFATAFPNGRNPHWKCPQKQKKDGGEKPDATYFCTSIDSNSSVRILVVNEKKASKTYAKLKWTLNDF